MAVVVSITDDATPSAVLSKDGLQILESALAPDEWASYEHEVVADRDSVPAAKALVERWKKVIATRAGSPEAFEKRLTALGLTEETVHERFLQRRFITGTPPDWALYADSVLQADAREYASALEWLGEETRDERAIFDLDRHAPPRFPELLSPFIAQFRSELEHRSPANFSSNALRSIARSLFRRLSSMCGRTVAYRLRVDREAGHLRGESTEARYIDFVKRTLASDYSRRHLLADYPVLARILATVCLQFIEASTEVMGRFRRDCDAIADVFGISSAADNVELCFAGLSDMHSGGRSAWILQFENGSRIVYKPRPHDADLTWAEVLKIIDPAQTNWRAPRILARPGYGWSEFVPSSECDSREQVACYFRRQGWNAAVIHLLCGQDFHAENFVACGAFPVVVDVEGLLSPTVANPPEYLAEVPRSLLPLQFTVANTLCAPYFRGGDRNRPLYVASGIGGTTGRLWPIKTPSWRDVGSDAFGLEYGYEDIRFEASLPRFGGKTASVSEYLDEVEAGFREGWEAVTARTAELTDDRSGPGRRLRSLESRLLFRDTQDYENLLFWTTAPDILQSGAGYDVALEMLAGAVPVFFTGATFPELIDEEKKCLWRRDIPIAIGSAFDTAIRLPSGQSFGPIIPTPMWGQMQERIRSASSSDLDRQCALLRSLFEMSFDSAVEMTVGSRTNEPNLDLLLDVATAIGDDLERTAVRHGDHVGWLELGRFAGGAARVYPVPGEPWSLNGNAGQALFLINLAKTTGEARFERTGRGALQAAGSTLRAMMSTQFGPSIGISGYFGYFGIVYALAAAGVQLEDRELVDEAVRIALEFPEERIQAETNPDFLTGAASPLAIIAWLYRLTSDDRLLVPARGLAQVIARCARNGGRDGWRVPFFKRPLLGMAHGSAGISMALLRLYVQTHDADLLESARLGIAHEREHFREVDGQWPNLQEEPDRISYMTGWCAGAAGIGLSRLESREFLNDCGGDRDIEAAIAATRRNFGGAQQHICCGESGRITFFAAASSALDRPDLREEAIAAAAGIMDDYKRQKLWNIQEFCEKLSIPGLMAGVPGIGLAFLNLVRPDVSKVLTLC